MKKTFSFLVLIVFLSLPLIFPFFHQGYFPTHDGEWAVIRLGAMHRALMAGHFPVRWAGNLNFSYGYPLFLFTYPLPYYLGEVFYLLGFGLVNSIKLLFVLSVIFSGLSMFFLAKEVFGKLGGVIAAVFYLYVPFRLVNLYVRGSLGESLAFILYPLLFLSLLKIKQGSRLWILLGALLYAALLLTHNISALLVTPFLIAFAILLIFKTSEKKRIIIVRQMLFIFILGLGLAAFFLIPALVEKGNIVLSQIPLADVKKHFVSFPQLIFPRWGYGSPGSEDAFSFQLGWVHLIGLLLAFGFWFKEKKKTKNLPSLFFGFSFASLVVLVLLMAPLSFLFWEKVPLFSEIDFPWRILGLAIFFLAISMGYLLINRFSRYLALGLAILVILVNMDYAKPSGFIDYDDAYYLTNEATTTSNDELMPIWVKEKPAKRANQKAEIIAGKGTIENLFFNSQKTTFKLEAETETEVQVNTVYFPGWFAQIDLKLTPINFQNEKGLIRLKVPPGSHQIFVAFKETPLRLGADIVSLFSLLVAGGLLVKIKKDEN